MNTPGDIAWLIPFTVGPWVTYLVISNWRESRRNRKASK